MYGMVTERLIFIYAAESFVHMPNFFSLILLFPLEIHPYIGRLNTSNQCGFQHNRSMTDYVF